MSAKINKVSDYFGVDTSVVTQDVQQGLGLCAMPYAIEVLPIIATIAREKYPNVTAKKVVVAGSGVPIFLLHLAGYSFSEISAKLITGEWNFEKYLLPIKSKFVERKSVLNSNPMSIHGEYVSAERLAKYIISLIKLKLASITEESTFSELYNHPSSAGRDEYTRTNYKDIYASFIEIATSRVFNAKLGATTTYKLVDLISCAMSIPPYIIPSHLGNSNKWYCCSCARYNCAELLDSKMIEGENALMITYKPNMDSFLSLHQLTMKCAQCANKVWKDAASLIAQSPYCEADLLDQAAFVGTCNIFACTCDSIVNLKVCELYTHNDEVLGVDTNDEIEL